MRTLTDAGQAREFADAASSLPVVGFVGRGIEEAGAITVTLDRLSHVINRHTVDGAGTAGKSIFTAGEDVLRLVKAAEAVVPEAQAGGTLKRVVDAGRTIGTDRATQQATSIYTVITSMRDYLITMHPGTP